MRWMAVTSQIFRRARRFRPRICLALVLIAPAWSTNGHAQEIPLPPHRPAAANPSMPANGTHPVAPAAPVAPVTAPDASGVSVPPIDCEIDDPTSLSAVTLKSGATVRLNPPAKVARAFGQVFAAWIDEGVAPAFAQEGRVLTEVAIAGSYECRGRNRIAGAVPSEHAIGNAIDIAAFSATGGPALIISQSGASALERRIRDAACTHFATVLGPGSDAFHQSHLHVDMRARHNQFHICQWAIPDASGTTPAPPTL